ncbi:UNKNOWN [Stylonychia lemnae]|uniref:Uncharacterized protein n=1 Tax=Stylonychia lemnae TaxID=5949 RepID=A0A078BBA6_STYLE|nr:UNKNOWN [Stylonychia lemnae]|eukprot:CDW91476.1 UNKNOWN [Stylonychia lemnae]
MPFYIILPFLPFIIQFVFGKGQYGLIAQAACHIGISLARIIVPKLVISWGSRIVILVGGLLAFSFFIYSFYLIDKVYDYNKLPVTSEYHQDKYISALIAFSFVLGFGIVMGYQANLMYIQHCAINIKDRDDRTEKEQLYQKIYSKFIYLFRILGIIGAALLFEEYHNNIFATLPNLNHLMIYCGFLSISSFVLALAMPDPYKKNPKIIHSSQQIPDSEQSFNIQEEKGTRIIKEHYQYEGSEQQLKLYLSNDILSNIFSKRMLKYLPHILCSALMNTVFESVAFMFMFIQIAANQKEFIIRTTFFMFIPNIVIQLLLSFFTCKVCFEYGYSSNQSQRVTWRKGAILNFIIFLGLLLIAIINRFIHWDFNQFSATHTIGLFIGASILCGISEILFQKQRRSLALQYTSTLSFYRATIIMEDFVKAIVQVFLFLHFYIISDRKQLEDILELQFFILIALSLGLGIVLQVFIYLCNP